MKELVWMVICFCAGAIFALGMYALIADGAKIEREFDIYREGFAEGRRDGFREGVKRMSAIKNGRVDVAPGPDSIRESIEERIL